MSESGNMDRALTQAEKIDADAIAWFVDREDASEQTGETQAAFDAWLTESPRHLLAYWRAEAAWDHAGLLTAVRGPRDLRAGTGLDVSSANRRDWKLWFGRMTAIAAVVVAGIVLGFQFLGQNTITYATPVGGGRTVTLADGSRIELDTDTLIRVNTQRQNREVELVRGEAFFKVTHDPAHPLVVTVGDERLVDLGTQFDVRRESDRTKIGLVEGSVRLESGNDWFHSPQATLQPGDIAVATTGKILITEGANTELADDLAWRSGRLVFRHATLGEAAAEFNRYNREKLVVADPGVAELRFSSVFPVHGIEAFARVAKKSLGLHVAHEGGNIVIGR